MVSGITDAVHLSAGFDHTCAVLSGGDVHCWGINDFGQLGDDGMTPSLTPVQVIGVSALSTSAGQVHTCARLDDGSVQCWGENADSQLGNGSNMASTAAVDVIGVTSTSSISSGDFLPVRIKVLAPQCAGVRTRRVSLAMAEQLCKRRQFLCLA
ncbi:MAG: hypothetical protein GY822_19400 [Deltaproteobacteria bacterium]|nr:hypothetical protein [Deltaproteobacteria bacterium]